MNPPLKVWMPAAFALLATFGSIAVAQWNKKPYTEWSDKEAQKVLDNSPWGQTQTFADVSNRLATGRATAPDPTRDSTVEYLNFRVRFLSAKPIRHALTRMVELNKKGNLPEETVEQLKAFAAQESPNYIVLSVVCDAREQRGQLQDAVSLLNTKTTSELKNNTYLSVGNKKRLYLEEYRPLKRDGLGARFIFPRVVDGQPFVTPGSDEIRFYSELSGQFTIKLNFKVKEMLYEGKLEY